jgi:carboxylesterase
MNKSPIFQNPDSDGGSFYWPGEPDQTTAIMLLHGFTATTVEVRPMAQFLNDQGFAVAGPLLPGHGVSPEELSQTKFSDWISAVETTYQDLKRKHQNIIVLGESMGGLCALWLAAQHPEITGVLVFAPALNIHNLWQTRLIWPFVQYKHKTIIDLTSPWQGFNVVPLRAAAQLHKFQQLIKRKLPEIQQPIIVFQGKLDKTIDPLSSVEVIEWVSSEDKELVWLEDSSHCILLDKQMELVKRLSLEFIQKIN